MPLEMTDEERDLRRIVAAIVGEFGHDYYRECSASGTPMQALWNKLGENGYLGMNIPEEYGGAGRGVTELAVVLEEMSAGGCPELAMVLSQGIAGSILPKHGTEDQKRRYLPGIASGAEKFVFALTEPNAGSNSHNISTTATHDGDSWVVRGQKYFISGVDHADHLLLVARTGTDELTGRGQLTLMIVDPNASGLDRQLIPTALQAPERQFTLFFDDVRVPVENVIGEVGHGLRPLFDGLNPERLLSAVICTGVGRYALDKAIDYTTSRVVFDGPIAGYQSVQHPLAEASVMLEAARGMVWRAAATYDYGKSAGEQSNMAKLMASRAGFLALDTAIQVHGGNGLALEYGLADLWGIIRLQQIAPVSTQMVLNHIAQHHLGLPRSY
ncbi:acyl-CoA dehydrogenase family protein [Jongsikchunia kroppenstedtii]|uniref:acyl-CoA dehydrogenase family protein n=1 Tax=Jongsikchunia kroppenstedtii TaxID=1121721 RepID=UPI000475B7DC|nr:acyl-CoA dehydrogenase family protein [Jongsikchunia kroppenstedtii]